MQNIVMSVRGTSALVTIVLIVCSLVDNSNGHGQMFEPPSRASAFRFGYNTPKNYNYDMGLNCGGFQNQWERNGGLCGICGDRYQGPREYEAGGKYATGLILRNYTEGQLIDVHLNIRVGHGGWSEIRVCPNNNIHKPATQACLDRHLLALENGQTRIVHYHGVTGLFKYKLQLPRGLTCTQCVMQWRWNTDINNNCVSNVNCCNGCGAQEQFYACADIAIKPSSTGIMTTKSTTTTAHSIIGGFVGGFVPINVGGFSSVSPCVATITGRVVFGPGAADEQCRQLCLHSNTCPLLLCANSCYVR